MNTKLKRYAIEQLASTGFVLLDYQTAFKLRPDIWATPTNCMCDMNIGKDDEVALQRLGAMLFTAKEAVHGVAIHGATRSMRELEKRIELIAGIVAMDAASVASFTAKPVRQHPIASNAKPDNTIELQEIAAMELPKHDCALRKNILRARQELVERENIGQIRARGMTS